MTLTALTGARTLLDRVLGQPPERPAIREHAGRVTTYGDLAARSAVIARALLDRRRSLAGAPVAMLLPPGSAFVEVLLGIWRAGGVAVPLAAVQTPAELDHILGTASPDATVVGDGGTAHLDGFVAIAGAARLGRRLEAVSLAADASSVASAAPAAGIAGDASAPDLTGDSAAIMLFTSGTTGKPKGVRLSHAAVAATVASLSSAWRWSADDRLLHALPLNHTHGLIVALLGALAAGASVDFMSFHAGDVWTAFARASVFMAVPTMYVRLIEAFTGADAQVRARWTEGARAMRLHTSGSAALPAQVHAAFADAAQQTILERYGMTEIGMALANPYDGPRVPGSVGHPLPQVVADVVDDQGRATAAGEPGELRIRSPQMFSDYAGDHAATVASFDEAGRFRTGDTAVLGADRYFRLLGRTSVDILKSGGYKLSALEIEDVLRAHPAVAEIAVIGVPDPVWGDRVTACVVPHAGTHPSLDDLQAFARQALAPYKLPRELRLLSSLPRNSMGKVQKSLLK